jgi:hypothetical protein
VSRGLGDVYKRQILYSAAGLVICPFFPTSAFLGYKKSKNPYKSRAVADLGTTLI